MKRSASLLIFCHIFWLSTVKCTVKAFEDWRYQTQHSNAAIVTTPGMSLDSEMKTARLPSRNSGKTWCVHNGPVTNERKKETDHHIRDLGRTVAKVDNPQLGSSWREAERNIPIADPGGQDSLALCTRLECKVQAPLRKNCAVVSRSLFMACNKSGNTTEEPTK